MLFPGGTKTITSPLLISQNLGVILSTTIKSFSSKVGYILAPTTVYGLATKNLINKTIPQTNTRKDIISKTSNAISSNFFFNDICMNINYLKNTNIEMHTLSDAQKGAKNNAKHRHTLYVSE
jgi:hypothetical protein